MSRKMFMSQAKKLVAKEMEAAQKAEASKGSGDGSKSQAEAAKKPVVKRKKKPDEGQRTLAETGLVPGQAAKKTRRDPASGGAAAVAEHASEIPVIEDLTLDIASSALAPTQPGAVAKESTRTGRDVAAGLYEVTVRYPTKGGLFNEKVSGHDVLFQAIPDEDRAYLRRQGKDVRLFDGGLDYVVQGAFMLMEHQRRQEEEMTRLREAEKKAASAD
ncbi:unnamed protein product, partial [Cuscuta epithymum]